MEEMRRGVPTWQDELASLMDGGLQYDGSPIDLTADTESRSKSSGFESGSGSESVESLKDQVTGFMKSWGEMLMDLAIGCKDVVQQMVVTDDSFVVRKLRKPAAKVSKKLSFLNEYLPEDRDPVHAWPVIFFVFLLALTGILSNSFLVLDHHYVSAMPHSYNEQLFKMSARKLCIGMNLIEFFEVVVCS
jgi:hypothetical protein